MKTVLRRIESIEIRHERDECPDTSYLGHYSNHDADGAIDRMQRGDMGRGEYRYFIPADSEYAEQSYDRMESLNRGVWEYIGIVAIARVAVSSDRGRTWKSDTLTSGGLWGIESDSGADYLGDVSAEQKQELSELLQAYGFSAQQIARAQAETRS